MWSILYYVLLYNSTSSLFQAIVRHEAAEALAAIGDVQHLDLLEKYCKDEVVEVNEIAAEVRIFGNNF